MLTSRVFLIIAALFPIVWAWQMALLLKSKRWKWAASVITIMVCALAFFLDRNFPLPRTGSTVAPAKRNLLTTMKIHPSAFPVSVPQHSTLYILPLHPFQVFTETAGELHEYENSCRDDRTWPSQKEIATKPANAYEEVRRIQITNHDPTAMEAGRISFTVRYNDAFAGGCTPPPKESPSQIDVIAVPTLDQGKSYEFVSVNQTGKCAWLIPPSTIVVKMADRDDWTAAPLKLEPTS